MGVLGIGWFGAAFLGGVVIGIPVSSPAGASRSRPPEGGLWGYEPTDVVQSWSDPSGQVRVHYSVEGPHATVLDDEDADGVPDYPQQVADVTLEVASFFEGELGLRPPLSEGAVGEVLGGGPEFDVYLVDFGGAADGRFAVDGCLESEGACAGFMVIENDFVGYAYPNLDEAVRTVVSHEFFHAIQAAYVELPVWMSEGTATWATHRFDETLGDFVRACAGYLQDVDRPLDAPMPGPVPAFAYGTALWWDFMARRNGDAYIRTLLEAMAADGGASTGAAVMREAVTRVGDSLADAWVTFARYNLATGFRAGAAPSHPYAELLDEVPFVGHGRQLDASLRLYPLATQYWRLEHEGGPIDFAVDEGLGPIRWSLHRIVGGASDGPVEPPLVEWSVPGPTSRTLADAAPPGGYWIVAAFPEPAEGSVRGRMCVGSPSYVQSCELGPEPPIGTTGSAAEDSGTSEGSSGGESEAGGSDGGAGQNAGRSGCRSAPGRVPWAWVAMVCWGWRRRGAE